MLAAALNRKFLYALTVIALLCAKFLHVFSHLPSTAIPLFVLYFPTFFTPDILVIVISRLLFQRSLILSFLICLVITFGSAAQVGLFIETGGELRWSMLTKVFREPQGFVGMLLTGLVPTSCFIAVLASFAYLLTPSLYNFFGRMIDACFATVFPRHCRVAGQSRGEYQLVSLEEGDGKETPEESGFDSKTTWARVKLAIVVGVLLVLHLVRPHKPFDHMTTTLPFTMFDAIFHPRSPMCDPSPWDGPKRFPYEDLIREDLWIPPSKDGKRGWKPGSPWWEVTRERPSWLPDGMPGFAKWYRGYSFQLPPDQKPGHPPPFPPHHPGEHFHPPPDEDSPDEHPPHERPHHRPPHERHPHEHPPYENHPPGYDSVLDPLKISNADEPLVKELQNVLQQEQAKPEIRHVIVMSLESTRKDVFPLVKDGRLYRELQQSWRKYEKRDDHKRADLSQLSISAEVVTGQDAGFGREINTTHGGLNVIGAVTSSTFTLKSLLSSHCGVNPLPVDFLEEVETEIYQPCLPQILKVLNAQNRSNSASSWREAPWRSVFMQAATSALDRQTQLMEQMGFDEVIDREVLRNASSEFHVTGPELNYFGYSERVLRPYMRKAIMDAEEKGERLFLSHLTTSTHHPWATPEEFGEQKNYWGDSRAGDSPWNRYLNTIKFADQWVGEVLQLLEELGVAEKTLVVMLGDHGFSFGDETSSMTTTYSNPQISSFFIPLVFYHPLLPRITLNATVTPLSVLPTILDLLDSTNSLDPAARSVVRDLIPEYEGQSLIRPFIPYRDGRQAWNFGVVNPGGTHLSLASAAYPSYRYVLPICEPTAFSFSHLGLDPTEANPVQDWEGGKKMAMKVRERYGEEAARWVREAEKIGRWYVWEARRRWGYWSGSRQEDRGIEHREDGLLKHDHWWVT
ncbi:hypothetical protein VTN77DRAFT_1076 [Rasamsonia byssochlamydoides]|uniref:uncharacterized protein n=1 Tax=Rasamsonia byssochlamydoides TaxID=89139 RepID=UPI0037445DAA